jgi:CSLREA domain-containing protein
MMMKYNNLFKRSGSNNVPRLFPSVAKFLSKIVTKGVPWLYLTALVVAITFQSATPVPAVYAAGLTVNSTSDTAIAGDGLCTLREAIVNANTDSDSTNGDCTAGSGDDTITFSIAGEITLGSILPNITTNITIIGPDEASLSINGNNAGSIFTVDSVGMLSLEKLTIANVYSNDYGAIYNNRGTVTATDITFFNNKAKYAGGGIYNNFGSVAIIDSTFSGNSGWSSGGGIYNYAGTLTVSGSTFSDNDSPYGSSNGGGGGGGIYNIYGTVTVTNSIFLNNTVDGYAVTGGGISNEYLGTLRVIDSTFTGNSAHRGGGIYNGFSGKLNVENSTFSSNSATLEGGGISNEDTSRTPVIITNSTFSGNTGGYFYGGGIYNSWGMMVITNSTFSGNSDAITNHNTYGVTVKNSILANSTWINCFGGIINGGHNLQFPSGSGCDAYGIPTADPLLGPLQDNGGPTFTHALQTGSPAIDAVPLEACAGVTTDQRGVTRPQGPACDIGAFEFFSPQKGLEDLIEKVRELSESGVLNKGQGNALIAKLEAAIQQLGRGNDHVVINQLQAFINEAEAMIHSGILLPEEGQPLIDAANEIITILSS